MTYIIFRCFLFLCIEKMHVCMYVCVCVFVFVFVGKGGGGTLYIPHMSLEWDSFTSCIKNLCVRGLVSRLILANLIHRGKYVDSRLPCKLVERK